MAINPDHPGTVDLGLLGDMLMAVDQELGLGPLDISGQSFKAIMNSVFSIMDAARGIVGDEYIDWRK